MQTITLEHDQLKLLADCVQQRLYPDQFVPEGRDSREAMFELLDMLDALRASEVEPVCGPCATLEAADEDVDCDGPDMPGNMRQGDSCISCGHVLGCDGFEDDACVCDCGLDR